VPENGWLEWGKHVLAELTRQNDAIERVEKEISKLHVEIATLKMKSGLWGATAGAIPVVVALIYLLLRT
jgi:hypothetical protein